MANIKAADVHKLRKMTGAGMMDCKKALIESDGDFDSAIEILRKKGQKVAAKRADKEATEGMVLAKTSDDNSYGVMVMVNTETDFVAKGDDFMGFVKAVAQKAIEEKPASIDDLRKLDLNGRTVEESLTDLIGKIGEKMEIAEYALVEAPVVSAYNHNGNKLGTLVALSKSADGVSEAAHDVAMQVAAMNPVAVDKDDVDQDTINKEIEIGKDQARQEGKPEAMLEKIAMGKLNKFFKENTLLNQAFIKDSSKSVSGYLKDYDRELTVTSFKRFMLGE
jgi:elongation factor Ts